MSAVVTVFQFVMNMASQWLGIFMGNWITSIFIFGCIVLMVIDLVVINKDDK